MWFTDLGSTKAIGRITPSGTITEYSTSLNAGSYPFFIVAGADGNMWFTDLGSTRAIGRITPSGTITEYSAGLNAGGAPYALAAGADGNIWFTDAGSTKAIGRITPSGTITEYSTGLNTGSGPYFIAAASDGNTWFTDSTSAYAVTPAIGRVGTGMPAASLLAPVVSGGGQVGVPQVCGGGQWANFASQQPLPNLLPFDGFRWLLNGSVLTGQTGESFTPTAGEVGGMLTCEQTVSYPLSPVTAPSIPDVSASATSAPVTVIARSLVRRACRDRRAPREPQAPTARTAPMVRRDRRARGDRRVRLSL
jgi:hypothetical protein